jgi:hypothetical protein
MGSYRASNPDQSDILPAGCQEGTRLSQTAELAGVKARIKALTDKTVANGCTEAEAMSAAEMVGRLLERYALSMDEIEARCVKAEVPMGGQRRRRPIDACVPAIARFRDREVWLTGGARPKSDMTKTSIGPTPIMCARKITGIVPTTVSIAGCG